MANGPMSFSWELTHHSVNVLYILPVDKKLSSVIKERSYGDRDCQILPGVRMTKHSSIINTDSFYTLINTSSNVK